MAPYSPDTMNLEAHLLFLLGIHNSLVLGCFVGAIIGMSFIYLRITEVRRELKNQTQLLEEQLSELRKGAAVVIERKGGFM